MEILIVTLVPAFAAGFAVQQLLELLDRITFGYISDQATKRFVMGAVSLLIGICAATFGHVRILVPLHAYVVAEQMRSAKVADPAATPSRGTSAPCTPPPCVPPVAAGTSSSPTSTTGPTSTGGAAAPQTAERSVAGTAATKAASTSNPPTGSSAPGTTPATIPSPPVAWDILVTALFVSAGTEGINSLLKFAGYKKEAAKADAAQKKDATSVAALRKVNAQPTK